MPNLIYYFSATGNSLTVAKDLAGALGDTRLIAIPKAVKDESIQQAEVAGLVYPVYMFGLPLIVADFIKKVKINPKAYIFGVATFGGLPGRCHSLARELLKKRGLELASGFSVRMPGNYTPLYGAIPQEKQKEMFDREKPRIEQIALRVKARQRGIFEEKPSVLNWLLYKLLYQGGSGQIPLAGRNFRATEACTKCGLCAKVCPVDNIELSDGRPRWLNHCQQCMACLQWCPVEAIQYKKSTLGRKRYRHPAVSADEIAAQK